MVGRVPEGGECKKLAILAHLLRVFPAELRADFQRYYGLNLDGMGVDYSIAHAADLAACLPNNSRCGIAEDPANEWTIEHRLLAFIEYYTHAWVWAHTKDAKRKVNMPQLKIPNSRMEEKPNGNVEAMTVDEMNDFLESLIESTEGGEHGGRSDDGMADVDAETI